MVMPRFSIPSILRSTLLTALASLMPFATASASAQTTGAPAMAPSSADAPDYVPTLTFDVASVRESDLTQSN